MIILIVGHWIGDYGLQTNIIAKEKSRNLKWLLIHIALYTSTLAICSFFILPFDKALRFIVVNGLLHLVTDFATSKMAQKFQSNQRLYYIIIGFDQMIHFITLLMTLEIFS